MSGLIKSSISILQSENVPHQQLAEIIECISEGFALYDCDGRLLLSNQKWRDYYGYSEEDAAPGVHFQELVQLDIIRSAVVTRNETGIEYISRRQHYRSDPTGSFEVELVDGRWIQVNDRPTGSGGYVSIQTDITELKHLEAALRQGEERFRDFAESAADWFWETDKDLRFSYVAGHFAESMGISESDIIGRNRSDLHFTSGIDQPLWQKHFEDMDARRPVTDFDVNWHHPDGSVRVLRINGKPVFDRDLVFTGYRGTGTDITEAHRLQQQLAYQASHDALTHLINRREFENRLQRAIDSAENEQAHHALCYLDLDRFKIVNDSCGHAAGDELLQQIGALLQGEIRHRDSLARLGGDEFAVLMEHCPPERAFGIAEHLRKTLETFRFEHGGSVFQVGVSIGLIPISGSKHGVASLLNAADSACYAAKESGRNQVHKATAGDSGIERRQHEIKLVVELQQALDESRFQLHAQPIVDLNHSSSPATHYEILLRLIEKDGSIVLPGAFLPIAEQFDMCPQIDRFSVNQTLDWLETHTTRLPNISTLSINLSGQSLGDPNFASFVSDAFEKRRELAHKICFEITETAAIANLAQAIDFIAAMKALGCRFALDDFGRGLSSFAYLKTLPVDYLKIDGLFVRGILRDESDKAMVKSIDQIGKVMGKLTIAEFVESPEALLSLREMGIDFAQGYAIGCPQPLEDLSSETTS